MFPGPAQWSPQTTLPSLPPTPAPHPPVTLHRPWLYARAMTPASMQLVSFSDPLHLTLSFLRQGFTFCSFFIKSASKVISRGWDIIHSIWHIIGVQQMLAIEGTNEHGTGYLKYQRAIQPQARCALWGLKGTTEELAQLSPHFTAMHPLLVSLPS